MIAVIFSYNMPEAADKIYDKLVKDGFSKEDIVLVDNGSDKKPPSANSNLRLPWNVRFTGQAYMALSYLLRFSSEEHFLLITTSAQLCDDVNYKASFAHAVEKAGGSFGFIASGLTGEMVNEIAPEQLYDSNHEDLKQVYLYQPIVMLLHRSLLELCFAKSAAYFNLELRRGWGVDRELQYLANRSGINCYVDKTINVHWLTNRTHKAGLADEELEDYRRKAKTEMKEVFRGKYGVYWKSRFKFRFGNKGKYFSRAVGKAFHSA